MIFYTLRELDSFFRETPAFAFYGMGHVGTAMLGYLSACGLASKLKYFLLSSTDGFPKLFCNKPVYSIGELSKEPKKRKGLPVFIATQEVFHDEIGEMLGDYGIRNFYVASNEVLYSAQREMLHKAVKGIDEDKVVSELSALQNNVAHNEVLFLSPPYWDVYSPFSAVPSLVANFKKASVPVAQADLGLECFYYLLAHMWKPIAMSFMEYKFYKNVVCRYKDNPYFSYADYCDAMWFFHREEFPLEEVKSEYYNFNTVQCGIIARLYQKLLSVDVKTINFNTMCSIDDASNNCSWDIFYAALLSDRVKSFFSGLPEIIGISVTGTNQFLPACKLASILKKIKPTAKLIMGGSCADLFVESLYPSKREIYEYFDYVVVGEGETATLNLFKCLKTNSRDITTVPNVAHINEENMVSYADSILEEVESLPLADYTGLDLDRYLAPRPILPYQASRGCHYGQCAFCNHNIKYRHNYRMKSKEKIVREIIRLSEKYGIKDIQFVDEAIRPDHFTEIVHEMNRKEEFHDINWFYYSRVSRQYTSELLRLAYRCGCRMVMFGVETFNQRLLNFIKKGIQSDVSQYCLRLFHENGIKTYAWLMGNLPSETLEELRSDIADVEKNVPYIDAGTVGAFCLEINTDMYHEPQKYNITSVNLEHTEMFSSHYQNIPIDKQSMLNCIWNEYVPMLHKHFFYRDRYQVYFSKSKNNKH